MFCSDLTATDDSETQDAERCVLRKGFARVLPAEEIVSELRAAGGAVGVGREAPA